MNHGPAGETPRGPIPSREWSRDRLEDSGMSRIVTIETPYAPGKVCADPKRGGTYAPHTVRAYVADTPCRNGNTAAAVLVSTDGRALAVVPATAEVCTGPAPEPGAPTGPVVFNLPAAVVSRAVKVPGKGPKRRRFTATIERHSVTVSEPLQVTETADNGTGFPPWSDLARDRPDANHGEPVSIGLSVAILERLAAALRSAEHGPREPQILRFTFRPDRSGNADRAVLVSSGPGPGRGEPIPVGIIMPVSVDGTARAHAETVRAAVESAADIARTTGASETRP